MKFHAVNQIVLTVCGLVPLLIRLKQCNLHLLSGKTGFLCQLQRYGTN